MLRGINKSQTKFNARVLTLLRARSARHADELNAHGTARGWWDMCNYFRVTYKTPTHVVNEILKTALPE